MATSALFAVLVVLAFPAAWGGWSQVTIVAGTSMEPTYYSGDLVFTWKTGDYQVGDIVVYHPDDLDCARCNVVHRVIEELPDGTYVTQGDNNPHEDSWRPSDGEILGERIWELRLGSSASWVFSKWLWTFILALTGLGWLCTWVYEDYKRTSVSTNDNDENSNDSEGQTLSGALVSEEKKRSEEQRKAKKSRRAKKNRKARKKRGRK